jgi:hypothetical protein
VKVLVVEVRSLQKAAGYSCHLREVVGCSACYVLMLEPYRSLYSRGASSWLVIWRAYFGRCNSIGKSLPSTAVQTWDFRQCGVKA